jgi:chromosome segregation ATPase
MTSLNDDQSAELAAVREELAELQRQDDAADVAHLRSLEQYREAGRNDVRPELAAAREEIERLRKRLESAETCLRKYMTSSPDDTAALAHFARYEPAQPKGPKCTCGAGFAIGHELQRDPQCPRHGGKE